MSTTTVTWATPLTQSQIDSKSERDAKCAEMAAQGKTDNIPVITGGTPPDPMVVVRTWTTPEDAAEWVAFLEPYGVMSAVITS